eukprot:scaffold41756_cov84-Attheya_sp.AAC.2
MYIEPTTLYSTDHFLLRGGVRISKQLTGLEYTLCLASLVNTPYWYVWGLYARLPDEVMIVLEPSGTADHVISSVKL